MVPKRVERERERKREREKILRRTNGREWYPYISAPFGILYLIYNTAALSPKLS